MDRCVDKFIFICVVEMFVVFVHELLL